MAQQTQTSRYGSAREALAARIRYVQDWPEEGVLFEDLTPVLADAEAFQIVVDELADACERLGAQMIGGLDARGFLLGSAVAYKLEGKRVVLVDDVLATGGTLVAARSLIEHCGGEVVGNVVVLEVAELGGRDRLSDLPLVVINE